MTTYYEENSIVQGIMGLLLGPILGLLYVMYLPVIAVVATVALLGRKVLGESLGLLRSLASFGWRPSEAYFTGEKKKGNH